MKDIEFLKQIRDLKIYIRYLESELDDAEIVIDWCDLSEIIFSEQVDCVGLNPKCMANFTIVDL